MSKQECVLGIDTSNYTTSVALTDREDRLILDRRIPLVVKQGERGLRQSTALFQHLENLPKLLAEALKGRQGQIMAVSVSEKPRPVEGSYMPVFRCGLQFAKTVADALNAPLFMTTHQEGHLRAAAWGTSLDRHRPYLAWHLSGGTCELLLCREGIIEIIGGSKDISFGQLIDRTGVALGLSFPCGAGLDKLAVEGESGQYDSGPAGESLLSVKKIPLDGLFFNVSGIESQFSRQVKAWANEEDGLSSDRMREISRQMFRHIGLCLRQITVEAVRQTRVAEVLCTGGVAASAFLRAFLVSGLATHNINICFGEARLSSDNACGTALLGGDLRWR